MSNLNVEVCGVNFKNPIILGSATPTMDSELIKMGIDGGAAGGIAKSLFGEAGKLGRHFPRPRFKLFNYKNYPDYPNKLPDSFTLHSLEECSHFDYETYMKDINKAKELVGDDGVIMASLSGATMDEWKEMCQMVNETDADWVELNVSCPFAADMGVKMGAGAVDLTPKVTKLCADILEKPFSVKISPQANDPVEIALEVEKAGAMAVNLSARLSGIMIDIETAAPDGPGAMGGWGGPYLLGYGLKIVSQAAKKLDVPIISGLGVWRWQDIIRYTMVGASLVQSAAGIMLQGYGVSEKWARNVEEWLEKKGYNSLDEIRGMALPNILRTSEVEREPEGVHAVVDFNKCTRCGVCKRSCFYNAIELTKAGAIVNTDKCDGCGMCEQVCPEDAIKIKI